MPSDSNDPSMTLAVAAGWGNKTIMLDFDLSASENDLIKGGPCSSGLSVWTFLAGLCSLVYRIRASYPVGRHLQIFAYEFSSTMLQW